MTRALVPVAQQQIGGSQLPRLRADRPWSEQPVLALKELKEINDLGGMALIEVGDQGVDVVGAGELGAVGTVAALFDAADARQGSYEGERARLVAGCWPERNLRAVAGRIVGDRRIG